MMSQIFVKPVQTNAERKIFLNFPWQIYRDDPLWVPPLISDWAQRIDPKRGAFFQRGIADFFIAYQDGKAVGTICAARDDQANAERKSRECVFGFFNFVKDYRVMEALLAKASEWALARDLDTLIGPFNLDYEDSYGILVEGRDRPPTLLCGHTPPYYLDFVERYGFQPLRGDNIAFSFSLSDDNPVIADLARMAERVRTRHKFIVRSGDMAHWRDELERIYVLLNTAMTHLPDYRSWSRERVFNSLEPFRKYADPALILFGEDNGRTIGWLPGLPNLNEALIHADGLRHPWDYPKLAWYMRRKPACLTVKSVLVPPEYWGSGLVILLFDEMVRRGKARGYKWIDASLTSADNPTTPALGERLHAQLYKRYRVYLKEI
jgi:hypothetical protein